MSYPLSVPVSPGDATEASQYNNLRKDALYLGGEDGASGTLRDLLLQSCGQIRLSRAGKTELRLSADEENPCAVMISGTIYTVKTDLTLNLSPDTLTGSGRKAVYAVGQSDGSFILRTDANSIPANGRQIGSFLWSGTGIIPDTVYNRQEWQMLSALKPDLSAQGRLTLTAGEPVTEADITLAEAVYYTAYQGNAVSLYLGGEWQPFRFPELALSLSGMQRGIPYDIFLHADETGLHLSAMSWGTTEARPAGTLTRIDGIRVSGSDSGKRYLGTIALNDSGYGEDSRTGRLLWNEYNRLPRPLLSRLSTSSAGTAHQDVWAPYFGSDAPEVRLLVPSPDAEFSLEGVGISGPISENDIAFSHSFALGISQDMAKTEPFAGNTSCVPVFTHSYGNSPLSVRIANSSSKFLGLHTYTLSAWSSYNFRPAGTEFNAVMGECPGLYGCVMG